MTQPVSESMNPTFADRMILLNSDIDRLYAASSTFKSGLEARDIKGNGYTFRVWDVTAATGSVVQGRPVCFKRTAKEHVTAVYADILPEDFAGVACATPTVATPGFWCLTKSEDITTVPLNSFTLTTNGTVVDNDPLAVARGSDGLTVFGSNHDAVGEGSAVDIGTALAADSSTTLSAAKIGLRNHIPLPPTLICSLSLDGNEAGLGSNATGVGKWKTTGDSGFAVGNNDTVNAKVKVTSDTTANDEVAIHSTGKNFKLQANKRACFRGKFTITEGTTNDAGGFFGFSESVANMVVDTTGAHGAFATAKYLGFFKQYNTLKIEFDTSNGSALDADGGDDLGDMASGTEVDLWFRVVCDSSNASIEILIDNVVVDTRTLTLTGAAQMYALAYVKDVAGTNPEIFEARRVYAACEV